MKLNCNACGSEFHASKDQSRVICSICGAIVIVGEKNIFQTKKVNEAQDKVKR